jgi:hypothetical protein
MSQNRKLKPDRSINGIKPSLSILFLFGLSALIFGVPIGLKVLAGGFWIYAAYSLFISFRTGNLGHLLVGAYAVFVGVMMYLAAGYTAGHWPPSREWILAWIAGVVFFGAFLIYLAATKKIKWRGREIFELAGEPVNETGNGYTPRPRPVGKVKFNQQEILSFARFCSRHLIAVAYTSPRQVSLVPVKMGDEYTFMFRDIASNPDVTWISFDFEGDLVVHISHKDYLDYAEPLAFDKLCESLGLLFIEFAELHQRGEGVRIIDRLDTLKMSYFS